MIPIMKAYCDLGGGREYSLDELNEIRSRNEDFVRIKYHLFCPECKKAKLSHTIETNIKRAYLSSKNIEEHSIDCVYRHDYLSKELSMEYIQKMNDNQIEDRLNGALRKMDIISLKEEDISFTDNVDASDAKIEIRDKIGKVTHKATRYMKLSDRTKFERFNMVYLFYGIIKLREKETQHNGKKLYMLGVDTKSGKCICWIMCGENKYITNDKCYYKIAVWGILENKNNFINIKPIKKSALKLIEVNNV